MEALSAAGAIFLFFVLVVLMVYPYLALARIWYYSKKQVEILREIRGSLKEPASPIR